MQNQNNIQIFENEEFGQIRTIEIDGQPWFIGNDVASILGYEKARNALSKHVDEDDALKWGVTDSLGRVQNTTVINESGLYSLILSSKLPTAKAFKRWVTSEILPSIRQSGAYFTDELLRRIDEDSEVIGELVNRLMTERQKTGALLDYVEASAPKVRYYDVILKCPDAVQVSIIAKDYGYSAVAFNKLLHKLRVQFKIGDTWLLYKEHQGNAYTVTNTYTKNGKITSIHTCFTQRGRFWLYDLLKANGILPEAEKMAMAQAGRG